MHLLNILRAPMVMRRWRNRRSLPKYTVACDVSMFWSHFNQREHLIRCRGLDRARKIAQSWVLKYSNGQARVLHGWHSWKTETSDKN